jgi:hypothetical protein
MTVKFRPNSEREALENIPRDAELIVDDSDTVSHWLAVYREQIEKSNAITASTDLDAHCTHPDRAAQLEIIYCVDIEYVSPIGSPTDHASGTRTTTLPWRWRASNDRES